MSMLMLIVDLAHLEWGLAATPRAGLDVLVQLRDRHANARDLIEAVHILRRRDAQVVVNDRADVCRAAGAAGVHLPEAGLPVPHVRTQCGPQARIGVSLHRATPIERARGADYALFGPVFATPGKDAGVGLDALAEAVRQAPCPIVAVGGVDASHVPELMAAGASGVAVIRAGHDVESLARALRSVG